jgi:choline-sulfatase
MVDLQVEQLIDTLIHSNHVDNTLIVFTSDHGDGMARHQTVAKATPYDEVCRVPFIVASLGDLKQNVRKAVQDDRHLVSGVDLARTICDYAEADASVFSQGLSLRPLVAGQSVPWRDFVYVEVNASMHLITDGKFKYVREYQIDAEFSGAPPSHQTHATGAEQLFDLRQDPDESRNLAYDPELAPLLKRMRGCLDQLEDQRKHVKPLAAWPQKVMRNRARAISDQKISYSYKRSDLESHTASTIHDS